MRSYVCVITCQHVFTCGPRQLFWCGPETPKGWTPLAVQRQYYMLRILTLYYIWYIVTQTVESVKQHGEVFSLVSEK